MDQLAGHSDKAMERSQVEDVENEDSEKVIDGKVKVDLNHQDDLDAGPQKWTLQAALAVGFLGLTWIGAQLPLYFMVSTMAYLVVDVNPGQKASWIPLAYILAQGTPVPFAGYIQDIVGRRWMTIVSSFSVAVAAVLIGTANTFPQIVFGSALAGAGGGIAELGAIAGVSEVVPIRARGYINGIMLCVSIPFGPYVLYGQLIANGPGWRWGMWIATIIQGLAVIGVYFTYHPTRHSRMPGMGKLDILKRIDWIGGVLLTTGFTLLLVALQSGGYTHPWSSAYVLCTLIIGIAALIALCIWEYYVPKFPILPPELFNRRAIVMAFTVASIVGAFYFSLTNFGPIYFSNVYATDPVTIGLRNMPFPCMTLFGAIIGNFLISRFPRQIPYIMAAFSGLMTLAGGLFILGNPTNPRAVTAFAALAGLGCGGLVVPIATVCVIASPDHLIATTVALTLAFRVLGSTIGYAIYSNIFTNKLTTKLPALVAQYAAEAGLPDSSLTEFVTGFLATPPDPSLADIPGVTTEVLAAAALGTQWAFADSLKFVFIASIPFGVLAVVLSFFVRNLHTYMTDRVVAHLHG